MNYKQVQDYLLNKAGATEGYPFDEVTAVFKIGGKMFALVSLDDNPLRMNLKCDPDDALALRDQYQSIIPGYHMNKKHWNTIILDGELSIDAVYKLIDHSYQLVWNKLPKKSRPEIGGGIDE